MSVRLAYLISQYPTRTHTYILREVQQLRLRGADIETVSIGAPDSPRDELPDDERAEADRTFYVKSAGVSGAIGPLFRTILSNPLRFARGVLTTIRLGGWDPRVLVAHFLYLGEALVVGDWMRRKGLVHVHTHYSSTVALLLARVFPVSVSASIHGSAEFREPTAFHLAEKIAACDFVRAISRYGQSQLMLASPPDQWEKLEVVPLGIDTQLYDGGVFDSAPSPLRILSVGLLAATKGYPVLISAVDRLLRDGRAVQLRLVGDGPDRALLEALVKARGLSGHVEFMGSLAQAELRAEYRGTDVFALASFAEGVPVVLIEAMSMGIPCVATGITGIPELIEHGVSGVLVPPADEVSLAHAIAMLADDPVRRRAIGASARVRVIAKYNLQTNADSLLELFERRVGHRA